MHIFISYAKKDTRALARRLRDTLAALPNVTAWMDESIEVGGSWPQQIQNQIDRCDLMVVLLSPDIHRNPSLPAGPSFVLNELNYALYEAHKPVAPVMAQLTRLPVQLAGVQYVDLTQNSPDGVARLAQVVCQRAGIKLSDQTMKSSKRPVELLALAVEQLAKPRSIDLLPPPFEWIEIPAGRVKLEAGGYFEHKTIFDVPAFMIAKYPITNAQYAKFIEAGGYFERKWWTATGWQARERNKWKEPHFWQNSQGNSADCPVVGVSWYEAIAFCQWLSMATGENVLLPTDQQWSRAAQGDDGRAYPWGNEEPNEQLCNFGDKIGHTTPVTHYPKGASPYGVMDMSGNVRDWCLTEWETGSTDIQGDALRGARGGAWSIVSHDALRVAARVGQDPGEGSPHLGFRCARTR